MDGIITSSENIVLAAWVGGWVDGIIISSENIVLAAWVGGWVVFKIRLRALVLGSLLVPVDESVCRKEKKQSRY